MYRTTREDFDLISKIADRELELFSELGLEVDKFTAMMDVQYAHEEFNLNLDALLNADYVNFAHDIVGIYANIDRANPSACNWNCFLPRFTKGNA